MLKRSAEFEFGGHSRPRCAPPQCVVGLRRWENHRSCLAFSLL